MRWTCTHLSDKHGIGSGQGRRLGGFEGDGAEVAEAFVPTVRVVPRFDRGEDGLSARRADQFGRRGLGEGSLVQLARVVAGLGDPVAQAIDADAQFPGTMGHQNIAGPCQQDRLVVELRGIRGNVRPDDRHGQINEGGGGSSRLVPAGPGWSRLVGGGRSRSPCGYRHGNNASTGHDVSFPGQCGRCAGDYPLFGCKSTGAVGRPRYTHC